MAVACNTDAILAYMMQFLVNQYFYLMQKKQHNKLKKIMFLILNNFHCLLFFIIIITILRMKVDWIDKSVFYLDFIFK